MGNSTSGLPYSIGEETQPASRPGSYGFSMHHGERKSDKKKVTVFKGEKSIMAKTPLSKGSSKLDPTLTQIFPSLHHYYKTKTLIHPHMLKVYATMDTDYPNGDAPSLSENTSSNMNNNPSSLSALERTATTGSLIIVTEPVITLDEYLHKLSINNALTNAQKQDCISYGITNLIDALTFLHNTAKVAHGNISPYAVFVTPSGDFKLSSLQLLTPIGIIADGATGPTPHFRHFEQDVTPNEYRSPERCEARWDAISTSPIHIMDSYALGVLLSYIYSHPGSGTLGSLPVKLEKAVQRLKSQSMSRPRIAPLSKCPIFDNPHVHAQSFLNEIATKSQDDKLSFYKSLPDLLNQQIIGKDVAVHKLFPILQYSIKTICSSDASLSQDVNKRECLAIIPPLFTISSTLFTPSEFQTTMSTMIELLFKANDRAIRGALLSRISLFSTMLDTTTLNSIVFEPMCSGFTDSSGTLRELTLKSAIVLVAHLSPTNLEKLTRYLVRLQSDAEDSIRTNTVIFIGKVAPKLSSVSREKLILPAFMRAMKDGFIPCRLAALKAILVCKDYFSESALASEVLPAVCPGLVDGVEEVRVESLRVVEEFLVILKGVGERMAQEERRRLMLEGGAGNSNMNVNGGLDVKKSLSSESKPNPSTITSDSGGSGYLSGFSSWASSKISSSTKADEVVPPPATTSFSTAHKSDSNFTNNYNNNNTQQSTKSTMNTTSSEPNMTFGTKKTQSTTPTFSSLSLTDAKIGGMSSSGWSDDEMDDSPKNRNNHHHHPQQTFSQSKNSKPVIIPSWASSNNDDFLAQFDNHKPTMRPRMSGISNGLAVPNSTKSIGKIEKPKVTKLSFEGDMSDGWDDF